MVISYHVHATYMNTTSLERYALYDSSTPEPYVVFNGQNQVIEESPSDYVSSYSQAVEIGRTDPTFFDLEVDSTYADSISGFFNLKIITTFSVPDRDIDVHIAVLQDSLPGAYTDFYAVCDTIYTFPLKIAYPDTLDTIITFEHNIAPDRMKAVILIQDMDSLDIYSAKGIQFDADTIMGSLKSAPIVQ